MNKSLENNGVYIIPTSSEDRYIVYSPLRRLLFWANAKATEMISIHYEKGVPMPDDCEKLVENLKVIKEREIIIPAPTKSESFDHYPLANMQFSVHILLRTRSSFI